MMTNLPQTNEEFIAWLDMNYACSRGIEHARAEGYTSIQDAVARCPWASYVGWLLATCADRPTKIRIATECARLALPFSGDAYDVSLAAIEAAEACIDKNMEEYRAALRTARATNAAADATNAAANVIYAANAANVAYAVDPATYAAGEDAVLAMLRSRFGLDEHGKTVYTPEKLSYG